MFYFSEQQTMAGLNLATEKLKKDGIAKRNEESEKVGDIFWITKIHHVFLEMTFSFGLIHRTKKH